MLITDITWVTDGEDVTMPTEVEVPNDLDEEEIADYLSDEYGFLIDSFCIE
jgi:hypothetical protein